MGYFDIDLDELVAGAAASDIGQSLSLDAKDAAVLGSRGNFELFFAVEAGDIDSGAEGGLGKANGDEGDEVVSVAFEEIVGLYCDVAVEVSSGTAHSPGLAFAGDTYPLSLMNAGGDLDIDDSFFRDMAGAATVLAGVSDDPAGASALGTS
jgi:hypothetical protein